MAEFNLKYLSLLSNSNQKNVVGSDFWIIDTEKVFYQGVFYLKVFLAVLVGSPEKLNEARFQVTYDDKVFDKKTFEFSKTDKYPDLDVVGCILPFPEDYSGTSYGIRVLSVIYNQNLYDYKDANVDVVRATTDQLEDAKTDYIKKNLRTMKLFPNVTKDYWQCLCGKPNSLEASSCTCCQTDREYVQKIYNDGVNELFWSFYSVNQPFTPDPKISFEENINKYSEGLKAFKVDDAYWTSKYDMDALREQHSIESEEYQRVVTENEKIAKEKQKKKKKITTIGVGALVFILFMTFVGFDLIKYGYAQWQFSSKKYEEAIVTFSELEDFMDSSTMVLESSYQLALTICDKNQRECIADLEDLLDTNHPGVQDSYKEQVYDYAKELVSKKEFEVAITYFTKISGYSDSKTRINEAYYLDAKDKYAKGPTFYSNAFEQMGHAADANYLDARDVLNGWVYNYAKSLASSKNYSEALTTIEKISDYLDANELKLEYRYQYGKQLLANKQYSLAVSTFTPISTYKDSATQIKEGNYRIALDYFNNGNYSTAYTLFKNLLGYRDSTSKYYASEDILYPWVLKDLAVSWWDDTYPAETDDNLWSVYDDYHVTGKLTGGVPGTTTDIKIVWCTGSCNSWTFSGYTNGSVIEQTFYWNSPSYYTPEGWYSFSVYVKVRGSWKLLDTVYIFV